MCLLPERNGNHLNTEIIKNGGGKKDKEQDDEAESRQREFMRDPYNNVLDFDGLNQKGRKALFPKEYKCQG